MFFSPCRIRIMLIFFLLLHIWVSQYFKMAQRSTLFPGKLWFLHYLFFFSVLIWCPCQISLWHWNHPAPLITLKYCIPSYSEILRIIFGTDQNDCDLSERKTFSDWLIVQNKHTFSSLYAVSGGVLYRYM